jgi:hypothetical protein
MFGGSDHIWQIKIGWKMAFIVPYLCAKNHLDVSNGLGEVHDCDIYTQIHTNIHTHTQTFLITAIAATSAKHWNLVNSILSPEGQMLDAAIHSDAHAG